MDGGSSRDAREVDVYTRGHVDTYTSTPRWRFCEPARILGEFQDRTRPPGPPWRDPQGSPPPVDIVVTSVQFQIRIPIEISINIKNRPKSSEVIKIRQNSAGIIKNRKNRQNSCSFIKIIKIRPESPKLIKIVKNRRPCIWVCCDACYKSEAP